MFSMRLPRELEEKLAAIAEREGRSKSDMVKEALVEYLGRRDQAASPFELGRDLRPRRRYIALDAHLERGLCPGIYRSSRL